MKAIIKNLIKLAILIVFSFSFITPGMAAAEETLLLASLVRNQPADEFDNYDFFPDYHREARKKEEIKQQRAAETAIDRIFTDVEWAGINVITPIGDVIAHDYSVFTDKVIIPYEVINGDYIGLIERVLAKYGKKIAEAADVILSLNWVAFSV